MNELTCTVASWLDRDDLVTELEAGDEDFGLVTYDPSSNRAVIDCSRAASIVTDTSILRK
jgi:hypothetical protein